MAIHGTGSPLKWSEIQAEDGGSHPIKISTDHADLISKSAGALIKASEFYGASAEVPPIWTGATLVRGTQVQDYKPATAYIYINSTGTTSYSATSNSYPDGQWLPSGAAAANYRMKWAAVGGSPNTSLTAGTWYSLTSQRSFSVSITNGLASAAFDLTIQETATGAQIVERITLIAESGNNI